MAFNVNRQRCSINKSSECVWVCVRARTSAGQKLSHLRLSVDIGTVVNQLSDHLLLTGQSCDVQCRVAFLFKHRHTTHSK